jgi:hypothetical protein
MEIRYKIESMEESGFSYSPDFNYDGIDLNAVTYQFAHNLVPNAEKSELSLGMTAEITPGNSNEILAKESIYAVFKVEPFDKVIQIKEGGFRTTEPLLIDTFVNIAIGALRGMFVKNLKGTPLAKSVMPLIPMDVIRQNTARLTDNKP